MQGARRQGVHQSVRSAYQSPASSTFLSKQTSHQQSASSTFLSEQISTSHQPPAKRTGCMPAGVGSCAAWLTWLAPPGKFPFLFFVVFHLY
jgi:hypothetical protein